MGFRHAIQRLRTALLYNWFIGSIDLVYLIRWLSSRITAKLPMREVSKTLVEVLAGVNEVSRITN
jgi:hypothetical protein